MKVLWISDAGSSTGFARVTHAIGEALVENFGHEIHVLAIGYDAKEPVTTRLHLYRADAGRAGHSLGFDRVAELLERIEPDVAVLLEDAPMQLLRLKTNIWDLEHRLLQTPVISYLPIDGYFIPPGWRELLDLTHVVALSRHGRDQLDADVPVVYHGVDTDAFHPVSPEHPLRLSSGTVVRTKAECREAFNVSQRAFVIGRADTNTGRKDWGSTWRVIENFLGLKNRPPDVMTIFHTKVRESGVDLEALISKGDGIYAVTNGGEWPESDLVGLINCWDVSLNTTRGEAFGFGPAESLACGVPVIATRGSAVQEVVGPGGVLVEPSDGFWINPYGVQMLMSDTNRMAEQLAFLARNPERREELGRLGREHVMANFRWSDAILAFDRLIESVGASGAVLDERGVAPSSS